MLLLLTGGVSGSASSSCDHANNRMAAVAIMVEGNIWKNGLVACCLAVTHGDEMQK